MARLMLLVCTLFCSLWITTSQAVTNTTTNFADRPEVQDFIQHMVKKYHFNKEPLIALFEAVKVRPQVIQHINKPLEKTYWQTYQMLFVNEWRIKHGVAFWYKYADALQKAEQQYGVPASIIVATIGIETRYGERTGEYRVIDSLTNLAFSQSPRAAFFRSELEQFLLLTRDEHLDPLKVMGSYAGAIGQPQFMPSSYRYYAINFSGSGQTDLMHNEIDVIGSIANYYKEHGWEPNKPVAVPAYLTSNRYFESFSQINRRKAIPLKELAQYGVLPKYADQETNQKAKVIELENRYSKEYWLGFHNFDVIKRYNPSNLYAMAVYQLSVYIEDLKGK